MDLQTVDHAPRLAARAADAHKGDYGTVLIVAGSRGMAGAAALAGAAAVRSGAGRVRIACPAEIQPTVATFEASYMTWPLPADGRGCIDFVAARGDLELLLEGSTVLAIGPGLGRSRGLSDLIAWTVELVDRPTVIDADALYALDGQAGLLRGLRRPVVLTPHPGEFARLTGATTESVAADRTGRAADLASLSDQLVVLLKGAGTVVTDGRRLFVNPSGNPGMATGGTGDVLTGVVAALLAQGLSAFDAAALGAYAHGLAGDLARDGSGEVGMVAGDLVDALPDVFQHLAG